MSHTSDRQRKEGLWFFIASKSLSRTYCGNQTFWWRLQVTRMSHGQYRLCGLTEFTRQLIPSLVLNLLHASLQASTTLQFRRLAQAEPYMCWPSALRNMLKRFFRDWSFAVSGVTCFEVTYSIITRKHTLIHHGHNNIVGRHAHIASLARVGPNFSVGARVVTVHAYACQHYCMHASWRRRSPQPSLLRPTRFKKTISSGHYHPTHAEDIAKKPNTAALA
jgi:hypothetical protein